MSSMIRVLLLSVFCPLIALAQINDEPDTGFSGNEADSASRVKFRGYRSAYEDLPFMNENWKVTFFQLAATEPARFDDDKATALFFYNYFSFNYKINDDSRIAVRPVFTLESPGVNKYNESVQKWNANWGDWYVQYSKFDIMEVGPFGSRTNIRLYAPTSEASRNNGMIAQIHPELYFETSIRRGLGLEVAFKGDYYFHSKRVYTFKNLSGNEIMANNKEAELESYVEMNQKINSQFNIKPRITWFDEWKLNSPSNNRSSVHTTEFSAGLGIDYHPTQNFNTLVAFSNVTTYYANRSFVQKDKHFDPNNNQLVALTNYRF